MDIKVKIRTLLTFVSFLIYFLVFSVKQVQASSEFSTKYNITYIVDKEGLTTTQQVITLTNKLENLYATEYLIVIGSTQLTDITASDDFGVLNPEIISEDNTTNINLKFDSKVIGKDKSRKITVTYKTPDFATVKGKVLEVGFPILTNSQELDEYSVTVSIPGVFGEPTQMIPHPKTYFQNNGYLTYTFDQETLTDKKGITATFGTEQILDFSLNYHLKNDQSLKGRAVIALPPDTNHQHILYKSLEPKPENVTVDFDGNWLAEYILAPQSTLDITAEGIVKITYFPRDDFTRALTDNEVLNLIKPDTYWESNSPQIKHLAQQHTTPEAIYNYLVENFLYDYGKLENNTERLGALNAIQNPDNAICMEFTDTFIAIARAAGIPAREHNGYAHTENVRLRPLSLEQDILHAWPEYYDFQAKQWVPIDPTWGNTTGGLDFFHKFDLDHFTFVIHGLESTYPPTVASYKTTESTGKDINVNFGDEFTPYEDVEIKLDVLPVKYVGLPIMGKLVVTNTGTTALYNLPVTINAQVNKNNYFEEAYHISVLPPYSKREFRIKMVTNWQNQDGLYEINIKALNKHHATEIPLKMLIKPGTLTLVGGGSFGALLWVVGYSFARKKKLSLFRKAN